MMDEAQLVRTSKYLSKHLRHQPERLGLTLEPGGWVGVAELLEACARNRLPISRSQLDEVVARNSKQRLSFDPTGTKIRANQGHSVEVDLQLEPAEPLAVLYHGTGHAWADVIERDGLRKMGRHHVHLSADFHTGRAVGARHGRPVVFAIAASRMHSDGFVFYVSENGVWLVDDVPPEYLSRIDEHRP